MEAAEFQMEPVVLPPFLILRAEGSPAAHVISGTCLFIETLLDLPHERGVSKWKLPKLPSLVPIGELYIFCIGHAYRKNVIRYQHTARCYGYSIWCTDQWAHRLSKYQSHHVSKGSFPIISFIRCQNSSRMQVNALDL